jgi:hypothetical protein
MYALGWAITILGITLVGEATRREGLGLGSHRAVGWVVMFMGMAVLGGMVGGFIASAL